MVWVETGRCRGRELREGCGVRVYLSFSIFMGMGYEFYIVNVYVLWER